MSTPYRSNDEKLQIAGAIDRLFILQYPNKTVDPEKISIICDEVLNFNYTTEQILIGIKSLNDVELKTLSFPVIKSAILLKINRDNHVDDYHSDPEGDKFVIAKIGGLKEIHGKDWFKFFCGPVSKDEKCHFEKE